MLNKIKSLFTTKSVGFPQYGNQFYSNSWLSNFLYGNKRISDKKLLDESYVINPDAYAINKLLALKASGIQIDVLEGTNEVDKGEAWDLIHPLNKSKEDFIEESFLSMNLTGDLYYHAIEVSLMGGVKSVTLEMWNPGGVDININTKGVIESFTYNNGFTTITVPKEDVLHIKMYDPTVFGLQSHKGLSPLQAAYMTLTASNNGQIANASMLKNGGVKGILSSGGGGVELGGRSSSMTTTSEDELKEEFRQKLGGPKNFNGIHVTRANVEYTNIGADAGTLQILESKLPNLREMCNIYGMPSQLMNDSGNKTYNNQKAGEKAMIENGVIPVLDKILRGITTFVQSRELNWSYTSNTNDILVLQEEQKSEAEKDKIVSTEVREILKSISLGTMKVEGARSMLLNVWQLEEDHVNEILNGAEENPNAQNSNNNSNASQTN